jgi:hypothetical protein
MNIFEKSMQGFIKKVENQEKIRYRLDEPLPEPPKQVGHLGVMKGGKYVPKKKKTGKKDSND